MNDRGTAEQQGRRKLSEREREEIQVGVPASELLPFTTATGGLVEELTTSCGDCGNELPDKDTRMKLSEPLPGLKVLSGHAICRDCRNATPYLLRFTPDGLVVGPDPNSPGRWAAWDWFGVLDRPAWWDTVGQVRALYRNLMRKSR